MARPNRSNTLDNRPAQTEMIAPTVASRIEERDNLSSARIDPGQIRTFAQVAAVTGERQIAVIIAPTVLAGYYVLDVMGKGTTVLRKETKFATVLGSGSDEYPRRRIHPLQGVGKLPSRLQFQDCHKIFGVDKRLVFRTLAIAEQTFVSSFRKSIDSFLYGSRNTQLKDTTGRLGVEAAAQGIEKLIEHGGTHGFTLSRPADAK